MDGEREWDSGDDVVEVAFNPPSGSSHAGRTPPPPDFFRNPSAATQLRPERPHDVLDNTHQHSIRYSPLPLEPHPESYHHHHHRHHHRRRHHHHHRRRADRSSSLQRPAPSSASFIDLTGVPDSPEQIRPTAIRTLPSAILSHHFQQQQQQHQQQSQSSQASGIGRHPRRTNSQRVSPPSLERSDGTLSFGRRPSNAMPEYIDLTIESPEEENPPQLPMIVTEEARRRHHVLPPPRPLYANHIHHHHHHHDRRPSPDRLIEVGIIRGTSSRLATDIRGFGRRLAGFLNNSDLIGLGAFNAPQQLDLTGAYQPADRESPKPPMEPPSPAREGFTRDTRAEPEEDEDTAVVCPSCNEELAYDPLDNSATAAAASGSSSSKKKRAPGEHHFWALKKCGHVYCADCFENRRPSKNNPRNLGFQLPSDKSSVNELRCAVEGCETKVILKQEWVGIFL